MVRKFLRTWWRVIVVAALLVAAIQFFVRPPGISPGAAVARVGASLFRPVYASADFVRRSVGGLWSEAVGLMNASRENAQLRKEVAVLEKQRKESRGAVLENRRLKALLHFAKTVDEKTIGARVIGHDVSPWFQAIFVDAGTNAGVKPGMAVVTPLGAVGRVHRAYPALSEVILVTDSRFAGDVIVERTRARAIAEGMGGNLCRLKYVSPTQDVVPGDRILFSGFDGSMPKGTLLGTVISVDRSREALFLKIRVATAVDFLSAEEVLVILSPPTIPFRQGRP